MVSTTISKTPDDLTITAREVSFNYADAMKENRYWHGNDPVATHFINALQATFPDGEKFFIESMRDVRDQLDPSKIPDKLKEEIKLFIRQEALHGKEHESWCKALEDQGYTELAKFQQDQKELREWSREKIKPLDRLASTVGHEHYTATIASLALHKRPDLFENAAEPFRSALIYHSLEEVEHKAVCFDLFHIAGGNYRMRMWGFLIATITTAILVRKRHIYLLRKDGLWNREYKRKTRQFIWGKGGMVASMLPSIMAFLRPSFHPWETDERKAFVERFSS